MEKATEDITLIDAFNALMIDLMHYNPYIIAFGLMVIFLYLLAIGKTNRLLKHLKRWIH